MALCEVVAAIAEAIAAVRQPLTPREAFLLHVLKSMPLCRNINRLDLWEQDYMNVAVDVNMTETEKLIQYDFELGATNLYGAYDQIIVRESYDCLIPVMTNAGVALPTSPDLSDW